MQPPLYVREAAGGTAQEEQPGRWRLEVPAGPAGTYRWAQLDDYLRQPRSAFSWRPPLVFSLRARVSTADLPGTWGFGLWNDPFGASLGLGGAARRLPALPQAAWFFYAGEPNYLALRDDHPAQGFLAATFSAVRIPTAFLAPGALALPLLAIPPTAHLLRRAARLLVRDTASLVPGDPTAWSDYCLAWQPDSVRFWVDGEEIFHTQASPRGPLGLVIWIDNQYAAFTPEGHVRMGTSANPAPAWMEIEDIEITEPR